MTRSQARSLIMEARVRVDGAVATKAGHPTPADAAIEIERPRRYVSRGGEKLEAALESFELDVRGAQALDVGASTGGFTDCLLQRGAGQRDGSRCRVRSTRLELARRSACDASWSARTFACCRTMRSTAVSMSSSSTRRSFLLRTILARAARVAARRRPIVAVGQAAVRSRPRTPRNGRRRTRPGGASRGAARNRDAIARARTRSGRVGRVAAPRTGRESRVLLDSRASRRYALRRR